MHLRALLDPGLNVQVRLCPTSPLSTPIRARRVRSRCGRARVDRHGHLPLIPASITDHNRDDQSLGIASGNIHWPRVSLAAFRPIPPGSGRPPFFRGKNAGESTPRRMMAVGMILRLLGEAARRGADRGTDRETCRARRIHEVARTQDSGDRDQAYSYPELGRARCRPQGRRGLQH